VLLGEPIDYGFAQLNGEFSEFLGFSDADAPRRIILEAISFVPACIQIVGATESPEVIAAIEAALAEKPAP
jgi:hypothetical protein